MAMKALVPAPEVVLKDDWTLLSNQAGRYKEGLRASVVWRNGELADMASVCFDSAQERSSLAERLAATIGDMDQRTLEKALLDLWDLIEGALREAQEPKRTQADTLVALARKAGELWRTEDNEVFVSLQDGSRLETWPVGGVEFRRWLTMRFFEEYEKVPGDSAVREAAATLAGIAQFRGTVRAAALRVAEESGTLYLDIGNVEREQVRITAAGWEVMASGASPVRFRRPGNQRPLPVPVAGGELAQLRRFVNVGDDGDFRLLVSWLLASLRGTGPYPVLAIYGRQGSAKSSLVRVLGALVDPQKAPHRGAPRDERDLMIAAKNGHVIAYDNLSGLPVWLSDALCRLATGAGFGTRRLYADDEEVVFQAQRPVVCNGIAELTSRSDLLDRAILLALPTIPKVQRQAEEQFWAAFEAARGHVLGALLTIVSAGLKALPSVDLQEMPRMADFARWGCACAEACGWTPGNFLDAYSRNLRDAHALALEGSPLTEPLRDFLQKPTQRHHGELCEQARQDGHHWCGNATTLHAELTEAARGGEIMHDLPKKWPENGRALSAQLRQLAPNLEAVGIAVEFPRGAAERTITLRLETTPQKESASDDAKPLSSV